MTGCTFAGQIYMYINFPQYIARTGDIMGVSTARAANSAGIWFGFHNNMHWETGDLIASEF